MVNVVDHVEGAVGITFGPAFCSMTAGGGPGTTLVSVTPGEGTEFVPGDLVLVQSGPIASWCASSR